MGSCGFNPLEYTIKNYGEDLSKYIIATKQIEYINLKLPDIKTHLKLKIKEIRDESQKTIDNK
jgi:hypothetical protein